MKNQELAKIFSLIGDLLELKGENAYKISAYRNAAETLKSTTLDVEKLWEEKRLKELSGVGEAIATKIDELMRTGSLEFLQKLEQEIPPDLVTLLGVPGIGAKTAMLLYKNLGIKGVAELEEALKDGRVAKVPGMGQKKAESMLKNLHAMQARGEKKLLLGVALPCAREIMTRIKENDPTVLKTEITGSLRRGEETVEQISIIATSEDNYDTLEKFLTMPEIAELRRRNDYKAEVTLQNGLKVEFIACFPEMLATTLVLTSGTAEFRTQLRDQAYKHGYELSLGGFIKRDEIWPAKDEVEVFHYLGLPFIPPELRNGAGEIEVIKKGEQSTKLIRQEELKGDLHCHSVWSDGTASIEDMARTAARKGYRYLLMTDHTKSLGMVRGLNEEKLKEQQAEIYRINDLLAKEGFDFRLLSGAEVEIKADGELDFTDEVLESMDIVVASLHSNLRQERKKITDRLLKAIQNPHVDIIAHPTGRIINAREPADLFMLKIFVAARETGTALEINSGPDRLDLKAEHVKEALQEKVKLVISSDAHAPRALDLIEYGVITARRGGATAENILNTLEFDKLKAALK
jgi:DNA polymerase (family 10)